MKVHRYPVTLLHIPADLRADPDGDFSYDAVVAAAGLDPDASPPPLVAALVDAWRGHPEGAAVVASAGEGWVAIVECDGLQAAASGPVQAPGSSSHVVAHRDAVGRAA